MRQPVVYLIPSILDDNGIHTIPGYVARCVKDCQVFFVENERSARRFLKQLWKAVLPGENLVIDNYEWFAIHKAEEAAVVLFKQKLEQGKNIGIISEAGCPGVADPGQALVAAGQEMNVEIKPLTGPSSIMLALMASGLDGQQFQFLGYLPIDAQHRVQAIRDLEAGSRRKNGTQIFIETPYRNNQLLEVLVKTCHPSTRLCIAVDLTGENEWIKTKPIGEWKKEKTDLHKRPAIFLLLSR